ENQFSTVDHLSNLTASLLVVKGIVPDLAGRIDKILTPMDWGDLYDPAQRFYKGGWRLDKKDFDVKQKGWDWYYSYLGADTRFGNVWGVGTGQVPPESWGALNRGRETKYGYSYFVPGWQGGGLFMQFVTGLFIDERETVIGKSAADFAWAQVQHADRIGAPVWGWSACESPDGKSYLGWGAISDNVVTPYASGLAALYYPRRAVDNLRRLEKRGVRAPLKGDERPPFRDSYDWRSKRVSESTLCLDQALMFLSLANILHDGVLWKAVAADPHIQRARREIPEYATPDETVRGLYDERDSAPVSKKPNNKW
ncbi:MAG TPA: glucoamylase family protein, partial [Elusimicrobiota bacterium]|nr:glucoamylase family protein [Elusimicrobiota bacterium]